MDPELDKRLKAIEYKLNENQQLLKRIRRVQRNAGLFKLFYWLILIGIAFGSFYFIAPYINQVKETYGNFNSSLNFSELKSLKSFLDQVDTKNN